MNPEILKLKAANLPVYTYSLDVKVILCFRDEFFAIGERWSFNSIRVASNSPLAANDVLSNSSCYYGNSVVEMIPYLKQKFRLGILDSIPWDYRYCVVDSISRIKDFIPVNAEDSYTDCGTGKGTVFIDVSCPDAVYEAIEARMKPSGLRSYQVDFDSPYHWSKLFPEWYGEALVYLDRNTVEEM